MMIRTQIIRFMFQALVLIGICSLMGLLSGLGWFFDLFNHFKPQALLTSALLFILALAIKDKRCILIALAIMAFNSLWMIERLYAFPASKNFNQASEAEENISNISVLFSNVLTSNSLHQPLLETVSAHDPDIMVAVEIDETWAHALTPMQPAYPYSVIVPRPDNFGMAIYSKLPFQSRQYDAGDYQLPLMVLEFDAFTLIAMHPIPPLSTKNNEELHAYLKKAAEIARNTEKPLVLVGDLNATIWSNSINELRNLKLMRTNSPGLAWTWPKGFWPLAVQIDHIFVRNAIAADFKVLPSIGSDHFPVKSNIAIPKGNSFPE